MTESVVSPPSISRTTPVSGISSVSALETTAAVAPVTAPAALARSSQPIRPPPPPPLVQPVVDPELENKVKRSCERISENLHICANEPSLALYRLAEHVRKALPPTVESRAEIRRLHQQLNRTHSDAEHGLDTVRSMERASPVLNQAQELLKNAIFLQQQIKYEQQRRCRKEPSMYQRLSAHISSVDIPDFSDLKETARETANRVELALSLGSESSAPNSPKPPLSGRAASVQESDQGSPKTAIARSQSVIGKVGTHQQPPVPRKV
ncbi:BLOC-1-related complex subunit 8 homolog [Tigriopus californicus]|uniref:BLOC-1-related complex subunit 8 homolog n=1 Tax=Tigriopus californicus TaxID=6832 RepID=UPI0027DA1BF1|nr:BLOC-1-related complex subunit 8 homolog [Tigriopus californicus]XP_059084348.1 BLOC-1-related complex subunit 8 homolog [Tigriopus californicus]XP_059084349.1 BLOC-1-related complex subunit 8 homolog [Tigriopus californicus]